MSEKNLPPTQQRRKDAREKGQLGISQDIGKLLMFAFVSELAFAMESLWRPWFQQSLVAAIGAIAKPHQTRIDVVGVILTEGSVFFFVLPCIAGFIMLLGTLFQTGFNFAPKAFEAGIEKLNPGSNLQQLVSPQKLIMLLLGPVKLSAILVVVYVTIKGQLHDIMLMFSLSLEAGWGLAIELLQSLSRRCLAVFFFLAVADNALQRYLTYRSLRMSIDEVRRDYKDSEGDPEIKGKRKQLAKEMAEGEPPPRGDGANAVVVNPEHLAIALTYDFGDNSIPRVVAKAKGGEAERLREFALKHRIPVVRYVGLARRLYAIAREDALVPSQCLPAVALLYRGIASLEDSPSDLDYTFFEIDEELGSEMLKLGR